MDRMDRRKFLVLSGGTVGSFILVACGNAGGGGSGSVGQPQATGAAAEKAKGRTRVVFWSSWGGKNGKAVQTLVDKFNDSQKDIYIENQYQGSYEETAQKLAAAMAARQVPELVALSEVTWNKFYLNQTLQSMDDIFKKVSFDTTDYVDPLIKEGTKQGKIWWVPFARSTPLFYYNRDMFKKAGLPDRGPKTWDELREWGPALKAKGGAKNAFAYTTAKNYNAWYFQGNAWQWGGHYSDEKFNILLDQDGALEAGEWARKFVHEDKLAYMSQDQSVDFSNGICATTEQSTGSLGGIKESAKFEVGTAFLPEEKQFGCPTGGAGLGVIAAAPDDRKQAAATFIKFLAQPENVAYWAQTTGYMPVTKAGRDQMQDYFKQNPQYLVAVQQLDKTQPQDTARLLIPNGDQTIGQALESIFVKNTPAADAFKAAAQKLASDAKDVKAQSEQLNK